MKQLKHIEFIRNNAAQGPVICPENTAARINKISDIRAVVFDIYGTLLSSSVGDISLSSSNNSNDALRFSLSNQGVDVLSTSDSSHLNHLLLESIQCFHFELFKFFAISCMPR